MEPTEPLVMGASTDAEVSTKTELLSDDEMNLLESDQKPDVDESLINETPHIVRFRRNSVQGNYYNYRSTYSAIVYLVYALI